MLSLYRTLSLRYMSRRWVGVLLVVLCIMLGVATLVATQVLSDTMAKATLAAGNPLAGTLDFIITNGDQPVDHALVEKLAAIPGVKSVRPRIFGHAKVLIGDLKQPVLVLGIELGSDPRQTDELEGEFDFDPETQKMLDAFAAPQGAVDKSQQPADPKLLKDYFDSDIRGTFPAILGKELDDVVKNDADPWTLAALKLLKLDKSLKIFHIEKGVKKQQLVRVASIAPKKDQELAALGGYVVILGLKNAAKVLGMPEGKARRLDIALHAGADVKVVRRAIEKQLANRAEVKTLDEQNQALQSASVGMKTGFSMCGVMALIVGMFLVFNALSVSVAERRHEIGILLALGATRDQVWRLFAGEAFFLGVLGAAAGIPMGMAWAYLGLEPMQQALGDVFATMNARQIELSWELIALAFGVGILSSVTASLVPAVQAAYEKPAEAVRRAPKEPPVSRLIIHIAATVALIGAGMGLIFIRDVAPKRWGMYGGLTLVMIGALLSAPLFAQMAARALAPVSRRFFPIEWRIAADNLVRASARTGMVIGALAAGVCLIVETAGIIRSNRMTIRDWVDSSIAADIVVTSGSPVGSGGQNTPMEAKLADDLLKIPDVEDVMPVRFSSEVYFRKDRIAVLTLVPEDAYRLEKQRLHHPSAYLDLYKLMAKEKNQVIISANFAALHHVHPGDQITLKSPKGEVKLNVIGIAVDYSWNLGTILMSRRDYIEHWDDTSVTVFDIYLKQGADPNTVKERISARLGAQHDLHPLTRIELKKHIDDMIEKLYRIALGQEIVVMIVAALGVVMALLISVLQRRREMGLLRAIGASRAQVVYLVLAEATMMGIFGSLLGVIFAIPLQWYALQVVFLEESGFVFPVYVAWGESAVIALAALAIAILAGVGPALYAVRERIPDAIAYE